MSIQLLLTLIATWDMELEQMNVEIIFLHERKDFYEATQRFYGTQQRGSHVLVQAKSVTMVLALRFFYAHQFHSI